MYLILTLTLTFHSSLRHNKPHSLRRIFYSIEQQTGNLYWIKWLGQWLNSLLPGEIVAYANFLGTAREWYVIMLASCFPHEFWVITTFVPSGQIANVKSPRLSLSVISVRRGVFLETSSGEVYWSCMWCLHISAGIHVHFQTDFSYGCLAELQAVDIKWCKGFVVPTPQPSKSILNARFFKHSGTMKFDCSCLILTYLFDIISFDILYSSVWKINYNWLILFHFTTCILVFPHNSVSNLF